MPPVRTLPEHNGPTHLRLWIVVRLQLGKHAGAVVEDDLERLHPAHSRGAIGFTPAARRAGHNRTEAPWRSRQPQIVQG